MVAALLLAAGHTRALRLSKDSEHANGERQGDKISSSLRALLLREKERFPGLPPSFIYDETVTKGRPWLEEYGMVANQPWLEILEGLHNRRVLLAGDSTTMELFEVFYEATKAVPGLTWDLNLDHWYSDSYVTINYHLPSGANTTLGLLSFRQLCKVFYGGPYGNSSMVPCSGFNVLTPKDVRNVLEGFDVVIANIGMHANGGRSDAYIAELSSLTELLHKHKENGYELLLSTTKRPRCRLDILRETWPQRFPNKGGQFDGGPEDDIYKGKHCAMGTPYEELLQGQGWRNAPLRGLADKAGLSVMRTFQEQAGAGMVYRDVAEKNSRNAEVAATVKVQVKAEAVEKLDVLDCTHLTMVPSNFAMLAETMKEALNEQARRCPNGEAIFPSHSPLP